MADNVPNDASRKDKAEGERMSDADRQDQNAGGITNRPLDEEQRNQQEVPPRGESQPGASAGHGHQDDNARRRNS